MEARFATKESGTDSAMKTEPMIVSIDYLAENYDAIAFDSYGVLVDGINPLPGAIEFTDRLNQIGKPVVIGDERCVAPH